MKKINGKKYITAIFASTFLAGTVPVNAMASTYPYASAVGVDYDIAGVDTSDDAKYFARDMDRIGFDYILEKRIRYDDWFDEDQYDDRYLLEADILCLAGHGNSDGVYFNYNNRGGDYATGVTYGRSRDVDFEIDGEEETYQLAGLNDFDVDDTPLAIFIACNTAKGSVNVTKLANENHGIDYTIGWGSSISDNDAEKWLDWFGFYLRKDYCLVDAVAKANCKSYTNPSTITNTKCYAEDSESLNLILSDYLEENSRRNSKHNTDETKEELLNFTGNSSNIENLLKNDLDEQEIKVKDDVSYSCDNRDLDEIIDYIKTNIDENFDINKFDVIYNIGSTYIDDNIVSTGVRLQLKYDEFVTDNSYYITTLDNKVDKIYIHGNPKVNTSNIQLKKSSNFIDEEKIKDLALADITLENGEEVTNQEILKKFDTEPYYVVITNICNESSNIERVEAFEYRV